MSTDRSGNGRGVPAPATVLDSTSMTENDPPLNKPSGTTDNRSTDSADEIGIGFTLDTTATHELDGDTNE